MGSAAHTSCLLGACSAEATMIVGYEFGHRWSEKQRQEVNFARTEQSAKHPGLRF